MNNANNIRALGFAAFILHLLAINLPFVNWEWVFSDTAQSFSLGLMDRVGPYLAYQANTFGIPVLTAAISKILPMLPIELIPRIIAATGFIIMAEALLRINRLINKDKYGLLLVILVFLNPLIWVFGCRGTADLFPSAVGLLGLALFWETKNHYSLKAFSALLLVSIAIIMKYHAVFFAPIICVEFFYRKHAISEKIKATFILGAVVFTLPVLYIILVKCKYGFWVTPPIQHSIVLNFTYRNFINNLVVYLGYLMLLLIPFSLANIWHILANAKKHWHILALSLAAFLLGYIAIIPQGEMNFGPLDPYMSAKFLGGCFTTLALGMVAILYYAYNNYKNKSSQPYLVAIIAGVVIFILVLSFTRPAQRYLMFILPLVYFIVIGAEVCRYKSLIYLGIIISFIANIYLIGNQYSQGDATRKMVLALEQKGLIPVTNSDAIDGHLGKKFFAYKGSPKKYIILDHDHIHALFTVTSSTPINHKTYALVPCNTTECTQP
jgi:hypothetical protein